MIGLFGVSNTSIYTLHRFYTVLKNKAKLKGKDFPLLKILDFDSTKVSDGRIIFVPSVSLFLSKRQILNEAKVIVFIFDAAVQCEYIKPIQIIDLEKKLESYNYKFKKITERDFEKAIKQSIKPIKVSKQTVQIIPQLIGDIDTSVLSPVMKFLYCVPNSLDRNKYSIAITKWFFTEASTKKLQKRLVKLSGLPSYFAIEDLLSYFSTDEGKKLKQVALEVGTPNLKTAEIKKIAHKHNVKEYEVLYMSSLYKKAHVNIINKNSKELDAALREKYTK